MILKRMKLHNYRQHGDMDIPISGTITAVLGPNGSGKTNFLGSLQFAFTGEQSGFNKDDLLAWGASEGYVMIEFAHDGIDYTLSRNIHNTGASLLRAGEKPVSGVTQVNAALKLYLDLDKDLCKQAVFVGQAEIDKILFTDPRVRELSFQKLMGIGDASKIHDIMGKVLATYDTPSDYDEQIADGKARFAELHQRQQTLQVTLDGLKLTRSQAPDPAALKQMIQSNQVSVHAVNRFLSVLQTYAAQRDAADAADAYLATLPVPTATLEEIDSQIEAALRQQQGLNAYTAAHGEWTRCGETLLKLGTSPHAPESLVQAKADYDAAVAELNRLMGKHKLHNDMLSALSGTATLTECPVCGSAVTDTAALKTRLTQILAGIQSEGAELRKQETAKRVHWQTIDAELVSFQRQYQAAVAAYQAADKTLKATAAVEGDAAAIAAQIQSLRQARQKLLADTAARTAATARVSMEHKRAADLGTELHDVGAALTALGIVTATPLTHLLRPDQAEDLTELVQKLTAQTLELEAARDQLAQLDQELARLDGTVTELNQTMASLDKTVTTLEYKRATQQTLKDALATLLRVRDWFHYSNGPHMLSTSILGCMNEDVNRFLTQFTAPFVVDPADDALGFKCHFTDGRTKPATPPDASILSGGEKIQLAVAFRFAAYCMFASKLGLLSLDEPTVYLDDANVSRFCDLLQQIRKVAEQMNLQVFIATHERSVIPFVDTVIELGAGDTTPVTR